MTGWGATKRDSLEPLEQAVLTGRAPAEELLELYHGPWNGSVEPAFDALAY